MKYCVILLSILSGFLGLICNPETMMASDTVKIQDFDNLGKVETVLPPEPEPEPEVVAEAETYTISAPSAGATYEEVVADGISIGGRVIPIYDVDSTEYDAGNSVYRFRKLLYGHNSRAVFGRLSELGVGSTFTITEGGVTHTYVVANVDMYEANYNGEFAKLQKNGSGNYMGGIANRAQGHTLALMTCAGEDLGGGRATHRLVVFADEI